MRRVLWLLPLLFSVRSVRAERPLVVWAMGEEGKKIALMARRFEAAHPGVTVETQAIPWEAAHAKLLTAVVGGIPPDVSQVGTTWMAEFATMDALEPLDARAALSATARPEAFFPGSLQTCRVDGALFGVPWYVDTRVLFYRKDLLASVGYPAAPSTWEELTAAARKLSTRRTSDGRRGYGISLGARSWADLLMTVWQNGGDPLRPTSPAFYGAVQHYIGFFRENLTPTKEAADVDLFHAFKTGYLPMFVSGPWMLELIRKELPELDGRWGVSMLPGKKSRTSFVGGSNLVVFKASKQKERAWQFLEFMSDPANQVEWMKITTDLPSVQVAWRDPYFNDKPLVQVFGRQLFDTASPPTVAEWEQIASAIDDTMERVVLDSTQTEDTIRVALAELETRILKLRSVRTREPRSWRRFGRWAGVATLLALVGLWLTTVGRLRSRADGAPAEPPFHFRDFFQRDLIGLLFTVPALVLLVTFLFLPIAVSFLMSLTDIDIFSINKWRDVQFIGVNNYLRIVQDPVFWRSLWNTLYFAGIGVPLTIGVSLLAAVALNQKFVRGKALFRVALFAPVVTTVVAVAVVWRWLYNPEYGAFNWFLQNLGLKKLFWLSDPRTSLPSLIIMAVWKNFGYNMVIFLAGLQTIPESQYEAARIDGASAWQSFRYITIPGLAPTLLFVLIMTTIGYLQFFAEPYVMTRGGPLDSTMSIVLYMYNHGFRFFNLGYASAISYALFGLIFMFTFAQMRLKKSGFEVFV
ncbi:MAG: extracellular solute-binding protein [Elusimicrobia bacterium]|nr:extracellular solute-binding protein [Elusimicrobiota bacterium]